jgi:hypothetical protein
MIKFAFAAAMLAFCLTATPTYGDELTTQLSHPPRLLFVSGDGSVTPLTPAAETPAPAATTTQTAPAPTSYAVDITSAKDALWAFIGALIVVVSPWLTPRILALFKINTTGPAADVLNAALINGLNLGIAKAQDATKDWKSVSVKSEIVADGLNYVLRHAGDEAAQLGITQDKLIEKLKARLAGATNAASGAPTVKAITS